MCASCTPQACSTRLGVRRRRPGMTYAKCPSPPAASFPSPNRQPSLRRHPRSRCEQTYRGRDGRPGERGEGQGACPHLLLGGGHFSLQEPSCATFPHHLNPAPALPPVDQPRKEVVAHSAPLRLCRAVGRPQRACCRRASTCCCSAHHHKAAAAWTAAGAVTAGQQRGQRRRQLSVQHGDEAAHLHSATQQGMFRLSTAWHGTAKRQQQRTLATLSRLFNPCLRTICLKVSSPALGAAVGSCLSGRHLEGGSCRRHGRGSRGGSGRVDNARLSTARGSTPPC